MANGKMVDCVRCSRSVAVIAQLRHQLLVLVTLVADGLERVSVLVLLDGKLAKATAQIVVFLCQHFDLLLDLVNRKRKPHARKNK